MIYAINADTLTAIADRTRKMAGVSKKLTTEEIVYWLGKVQYIPQGHAESEFDLNLQFDSAASGILQDVVIGTAESVLILSGLFDSSAVGELV